MKKAIVICSGGLDSVVTSHYVKKQLSYNKLIILFFNYGQLSLNRERKASKLCAKSLNAKFIEIKIPELKKLALSPLVKKSTPPKASFLKNTKKESEHWYLPWRNLVFLSYAMAYAESQYIKNKLLPEIFVGFKCEGSESYPDASSAFVSSFNSLIKKSSKVNSFIHAPLIKKDKEDIVSLGESLKVPLEKTYSCYVGRSKHCGACLACRLRKAGFYWADIKDKTKYSK